jgi:hypothetical protein
VSAFRQTKTFIYKSRQAKLGRTNSTWDHRCGIFDNRKNGWVIVDRKNILPKKERACLNNAERKFKKNDTFY